MELIQNLEKSIKENLFIDKNGDRYFIHIINSNTFSIDMGVSYTDGTWEYLQLNLKQLITLFGEKEIKEWLKHKMAREV